MKNQVSVSAVGSYFRGGYKCDPSQSSSDIIKRLSWLPDVSILKRTFIMFVVTCITGCSSISTLISPPTVVVTDSKSLQFVSGAEDFIHVVVRNDIFCRLSPVGKSLSASDSLSDSKGDALSTGDTDSSVNLGSSAYLVSEVMYRICEFSTNYKLSKTEAQILFVKGLEAVSDISGNPSEISTQVTAAKP